MLAAVFELARPLLYALDPEQAHELTLKSLEAGIYPRPAAPDDPSLGVGVELCAPICGRYAIGTTN
jgi:dihydroorotate dehydrogenase